MRSGRWVERMLLVLGMGMMVAGLAGGRPADAAPGGGGNKESREHGRVLFEEKGCGYCHGTEAQGTQKAPSLQGVGRRLHKDAIQKQIEEGGKEMPAFGDSLTPQEMKDLVEYLGAMKKKSAR